MQRTTTQDNTRWFTRMAQGLRAFAAIAVAGALVAACDVHGVSAPGAVTSLSVTPNATLLPGGTQQMSATALDADGRVVTVTPVWSVIGSGGTVNASGLFTAGTLPGTYANTVKATFNGVSGTATIVVSTGPIATITVTPTPVTMLALGVQQFTAVAKDAAGNPVSFIPTWSVVSGGGAIDQNGFFTAGGAVGTFTNTVQASNNGIRGNATVIVTPSALATITVTPNPMTLAVGATQQYTAVGKDISGNVVTITPTWSIAAGGGAISATGVFTAGTTPGTFTNTIKAASGVISGTATVTVVAGPLASITVTPNPVSLAIGAQQQFTAVGKDASGNVIAITPVWSVINGGGTIIAPTGLFTANTTPGTYTNTVQATASGISGTATVTVAAGALATITVTPNPVTMAISTTQQFTAVGKDIAGNVIPITPIWAVVAGGGTINATGLFTAGAVVGTYSQTVQASSNGILGTATVAVTPGPLATIIVTPNPVSMPASFAQQFIAVGQDASGNVFVITPVWTVVNGGGAINGSTGVFTAGTVTGTYTNTVKATSGAISGTATVTVTSGPLSTLAVTPNPGTLATGGAQQFTATGKDANGNVIPVTATWAVINGGGTINATGLFTAGIVAGAFINTVQATALGITATATVIVTPGPAATITVTPNPATVVGLATQQFTAVAKDANNNTVVIVPVWSVVNGGGAINAGTGLFTAGAATGTFLNTVKATSGLISGTATVIITSPPPANFLGVAAPNGIMAGASVTCTNTSTINADVTINPGSTINGFGPPPLCTYTGTLHVGVDPVALAAQTALTGAYTTLMGMPCSASNVISADLGGTTKAPGVWCNVTPPGPIAVTGTVTLDAQGDPNAVWVFQAGSTLTTAGNVVVIGGGSAKNVYWVVGSSATIGAGSLWQGNIVALTSITLNTGATLNGRALARNGSVTLTTGNTITLP